MDSSLHPHGETAGGATAGSGPSALRAGGWALAGAGCGLVLWLALSAVMLLRTGDAPPELVRLQVAGLGLGTVLAGFGLVLSWSQPSPAGRRWRQSLAAQTVVVTSGATLALLLRQPQADPTVLVLVAALAGASALTAVALQVVLEAGDVERRLPACLALALLGGAALLFALAALRWPGPMPASAPMPALAILVLAAAALLLALWLPGGGLRPWRRRRMRWLTLGLVAVLPLLLAGLAYLRPGWALAAWTLVAVSVLLATALERMQAR